MTQTQAKKPREKDIKRETGVVVRFNMDVTPEDLAQFKRAAEKAGMTMSAWARIKLREAAQ